MSKILLFGCLISVISRSWSSSLLCDNANSCESCDESFDSIYCLGYLSCADCETLKIRNNLDCIGEESCINTKILTKNGSSEVNCNGYRACSKAEINDNVFGTINCFGENSCEGAELVTFGSIYCSGRGSCMEAIKIQSSNYKIICDGIESCGYSKIYGYDSSINCIGFQSCIESRIYYGSKGLVCDGAYSCDGTIIEQTPVITGNGDYALDSGYISSKGLLGNSLTINLNGNYSGNGLEIDCYNGYSCHINCNSNTACNNIKMNCYDDSNCSYSCNGNWCNEYSNKDLILFNYPQTVIATNRQLLGDNSDNNINYIGNYNYGNMVIYYLGRYYALILSLGCGLIICCSILIFLTKYKKKNIEYSNIAENSINTHYGSFEFESNNNKNNNKLKLIKYGLIFGLILGCLLVLISLGTISYYGKFGQTGSNLSLDTKSYVASINDNELISSYGNCYDDKVCSHTQNWNLWAYWRCSDTYCEGIYGDELYEVCDAIESIWNIFDTSDANWIDVCEAYVDWSTDDREDCTCPDGHTCCWDSSKGTKNWGFNYYCKCSRYSELSDPTNSPTNSPIIFT